MIEELSARELEVLKPYLKLIDTQAREITQLGMEVDTLRYNKRFTNTKFVKAELANPTFVPATNVKGMTYVQEQTKLKRRKK